MRKSSREDRRASPGAVARAILLAGLACIALGGCAASRPAPVASGAHRLAGSFAVSAPERPAGESLVWARGAVVHDGKQIPFTVDGLEVGSAGFSGVVVVGEVYDLDRPEQLAGTYERVVAAVDLGEEPGGALLGNEHGVLLVLRALDADTPVGPAPDGMVVKLAP